MTFKEALELALARINETVEDVEDEAIETVKEAINQAYMTVRSTIDRKSKVTTITYANPMVLPDDCIDVIKVVHSISGELSPLEHRRDGDLLHFNSNYSAGDISLTYSFFPDELVEDANPILVKTGYIRAIAAFGAYAIQLHRRKYASAQMLQAEFQSVIQPEMTKPKN